MFIEFGGLHEEKVKYMYAIWHRTVKKNDFNIYGTWQGWLQQKSYWYGTCP
jgi:hypothetical protein